MPGYRARPRRTRSGTRIARVRDGTLRTVAAILANPRYTSRQVWNRQRTDFDLADPGRADPGGRPVRGLPGFLVFLIR